MASDRYDSRPDTYEHIGQVRRRLLVVVNDLLSRADVHDASKLVEPELAIFDEFTPKLRDSPFGTPGYDANLKAMGAGLAHHYAANRHHPEHFPDGIHGMSLLDLIEMLADWAAAVQRHPDGDLAFSIEMNQERFGYGAEIKALLLNTARDMGWLPDA